MGESNGNGEGGSDSKKLTMDSLNEHKSQGDLWLAVHGKVYDVSKFMDEHPGGDEVLLSEAGRDATDAFEDVGHSDDARALLPDMLKGELEGAESKSKTGGSNPTPKVNQAAQQSSNPILMFIPLMVLGAWLAYRYVQDTQ